MDQCLGRTAGNALEVAEALAVLAAEGATPRLLEVTLALGRRMLALGGLARAIGEGAPARRGGLARLPRRDLRPHGGGAGRARRFVDRPAAYLPHAPVVRRCGGGGRVVSAIDTRGLGVAVVALGGGRPVRRRDRPAGRPRAGTRVGERVGDGEPLCEVHAPDEAAAEACAAQIRAASTVAETAPAPAPVIREGLA